MPRKALVLILVQFFFLGAAIAAGYGAELNKQYLLRATLKPEMGRITAHQTIVFKNNTTLPVNRIYLRLAMNHFQNSQSLMAADLLTEDMQKTLFAEKSDWGRIVVENIRLSGSDINESLQTKEKMDSRAAAAWRFLDLPSPLPPNREMSIEIDFTTYLPAKLFGNDFDHQLFVAAYWFPQLYSAASVKQRQIAALDVSQDFSAYSVEFVVPQGYHIIASAPAVDTTEVEGNLQYRFRDSRLRDFALIAARGFKVIEKDFQYEEMSPVTMRLFCQDRFDKDKAVFGAVENLLKYYGLWYAPYSKSVLNLAVLPHSACLLPAAFPGLGIISRNVNAKWEDTSLTALTILNSGLQYWQQLLSLTFNHANWIEAGLNFYSQSRLLITVYGYLPYERQYLALDHAGLTWKQSNVRIDPRNRLKSRLKAIQTSHKLHQITVTEANRQEHILKSALLFWTLENLIEDQTFSPAIKQFVQKHQFEHTRAGDLIASLAKNQKTDLQSERLFEQILTDAMVLDYKVKSINSRNLKKQGFLNKTGNQDYIDEPTQKVYNTVTVERVGAVALPVNVVLTMANGETLEWIWDGKDRIKQYKIEHATAVNKVEIDPNHKIVLDLDRTNNSLYRKKNIWAPLKWTSMWMFWIQHYFEVLASIS